MTQGSVADFMTALEGLHNQVAAALADLTPSLEVRVYRWRPIGLPELPAIYNWIADSPYRVVATGGLVEDTLNIRARVATAHVDGEEDGLVLERIVDTYRHVFDTALYHPASSPFTGIAKVVDRTGARNLIDRFNDIPVLCMEFGIVAQLNRILTS